MLYTWSDHRCQMMWHSKPPCCGQRFKLFLYFRGWLLLFSWSKHLLDFWYFFLKKETNFFCFTKTTNWNKKRKAAKIRRQSQTLCVVIFKTHQQKCGDMDTKQSLQKVVELTEYIYASQISKCQSWKNKVSSSRQRKCYCMTVLKCRYKSFYRTWTNTSKVVFILGIKLKHVSKLAHLALSVS